MAHASARGRSGGIVQGSRCRQGALVERAYYGPLFWEGMAEQPAEPIRRLQTLFSVLIGTERGRKPQELEEGIQGVLRHPSHYAPSQQLGSDLRAKGVERFEDLSARSRAPLVQVGLFSPLSLRSTPFGQLDITAEIRSERTTFGDPAAGRRRPPAAPLPG